MDSIVTKNYATDGGDTWVVGGKLIIEDGAEVEGLDGGAGVSAVANLPASTATAVAALKNDFNALLIKLKNDPASREEIHAAAEAFKAETIDYTKDSIVLRLIGNSIKMDDFITLMRDFTILEICRTGTASIEKGSATLRQNLNL